MDLVLLSVLFFGILFWSYYFSPGVILAGDNEGEHIKATRMEGEAAQRAMWGCTIGNVEMEINPGTINFVNRQALNVWVHVFLKTGEKDDDWALIAKFHLGNPSEKARIGSMGNPRQFVHLDQVLGTTRKLIAGDVLWVQVETLEQKTQKFLKRILPSEPRTKRERPTDATTTSFLGNAQVTLP